MKFPRIIVCALVTTAIASAPSGAPANAVIPASCKLIVTNSTDHLDVIDIATGNRSTFPSNSTGAGGPGQYDSAFDRAGDKLFVANTDNTIRVFDTTNFGNLGLINQSAYSLATSPIRDEIYAADYTGDQLIKINSATITTVSAVSTGTDPADIIVSPDGTFVYVANSNNVPGSISRVDTASFASTSRSVSNAGNGNSNPNGLSISPDGSRLFFAGTGSNRLVRVQTSEFDSASLNLTSGVTVGAQNYQTASTSDGTRIFVAASLDNKVYVVDASTLQVTAAITVGSFPYDLAVTPDDAYLYVANFFSNSVSKIRLTDNQVVTSTVVGAGPSSLTIGGPGCWSQPQATPSPQPFVPLWRATLDPNGGTCADDTPRTASWTSAFVGYGYLPGPSDCSRSGHVFAGWANVTTPNTVRDLPLLDDPTSNTKRYFVAENVDLVAVWKPLPTSVGELTVFANFFCRQCTNAWLIHGSSEHATSYDYTINATPVTCAPSVAVFGLQACQITGLPSGTPLAATVTPRNSDGVGPSATARLTLRG